MKNFKRCGWAFAWTVVAALPTVGAEVQDSPPLYDRQCFGEKEDVSLDVVTTREIVFKAKRNLLYSSRGWALEAGAPNESTVSLVLVPEDGGEPIVLAEGLTGYEQSYNWTLHADKKVYTLYHYVVTGSETNASETLSATFDFTKYTGRWENEDEVYRSLCAAVLDDSPENSACRLVYDSDDVWTEIGGAGDGLRSPTGAATSALTFTCGRSGAFGFSYQVSGGTLTMSVDGVVVKTVSVDSPTWIDETLVSDLNADHTVVLRFVPSTTGGSVSVRAVRWRERERLALGSQGAVRLDLREGVRAFRRAAEILPIVYSSTNFTGDAGTAVSLAKVSVVQLQGEGEDLASWTNAVNEIAGTHRTLVLKAGEGTRTWCGNTGVWKLEFDILADATPGAESVHHEYAIFDLRRCTYGFVFILK